MDLNDRVAVVTGASGEIGARIAYRLAAAGADVVVTYVDNHEGALVTCRSVESLGRRTAAIRLDQTDPSSVAAAIEAAAGQWSRLRHERARPLPARARGRASPPAAGRRSHRQHRVGRGPVAGWQ